MGDYVVVETSVHQYLSTNYLPARGEIMRSELEQGALGQRGIDFGYKYTVHGTDYFGRRYRYDERHVAFDYRAVANAFASGTIQRVFYNPANPADSLLSPGLVGCDLLLVLFGIPLNVVTFAVWMALIRAWREPRPVAPAGGVRILRQPKETRARLVEFSPCAAGFLALAASSFAASMLIVFSTGFAPGFNLMLVTAALVAATGLGAFVWTAQRQHQGQCDLRIDDEGKTLVLPPAAGRTQPLTIARQDALAVCMCRRVNHGPSGQSVSYLPALDAALKGQPQRLLLINRGWSQDKAQAFADWLSHQLGVPFKGVEG
jgi:hypothetical protein